MPLSQTEKDLLARAKEDTVTAAREMDTYTVKLNEWNNAIQAKAPQEELKSKMADAKAQFAVAKAAVVASNDSAYAAYEKINANPNSQQASSDPAVADALSESIVYTRVVANSLVPGLKAAGTRVNSLIKQTESPTSPPPETDGNTAPTGSTEGNTTKNNEDVKAEEPTPKASSQEFPVDDRYKDVGKTNEEDKSGNGDASQSRLSTVGLAAGGVPKNMEDVERSTGISVRTGFGEGPSTPVDEDWRVRISLATNATIFYKGKNPGIQSPLLNTSGVVFPYTPSISVQHNARYGETKLTHSNYTSYFYEGSDVSAISISGEFTVQSEEEGKYVLAAMTFFRSCTKMWFGNQTQPLAGNPPPMVFLNGFGKLYFPNVPCVITGFNHTMPAEVDYIEVKHSADELNPYGTMKTGGVAKSQSEMLTNAATRVPTSSTMAITVQPVYSRKFIHENFNLDSFADGSLLLTRGGFL